METISEKPKKPTKDLSWQNVAHYGLLEFPTPIWPKDGVPIAVDIETTGLDVEKDTIVGISICIQPGVAYYAPIAHNNYVANFDLDEIIGFLNSTARKHLLVFFNAKFDLTMLQRFGLRQDVKFVDAQIHLYATHAHRFFGGSGLKKLYKKLFDRDMLDIHELFGLPLAQYEREKPNFANLPVDEKLLSYVCADAHATLDLYNYAAKHIDETTSRISQLDHKVVQPIRAMEQIGVTIDLVRLEQLDDEIADEKRKLVAAMRERMGAEVNLNSPPQLRQYFFEKLALKPIKLTEKEAPATSKTALLALKRRYGKKYPELDWLIEYRSLDILQRNYLKPIRNGIKPGTSKIYPQFKVASTVTGRITSTGDGVYLDKLNFQGIPKDLSKSKFNIREIFVPRPGYKWLSIDLASIEPRLIAEMSRDPELIKIYQAEDSDLYTPTAEYLFGVNRGDKDFLRQRKITKIILLAMFYSFGIYSIKNQLEDELGEQIADEKVWEFREALEGRFCRWTEWRKEIIGQSRTTNVSRTLWGRPQSLTTLYSTNVYFGCAGDRTAVNHPVQGTAADFIRRALNSTNDFRQRVPSGTLELLTTVHDEINFEIKKERFDEIAPELHAIMEWTPKSFVVPIKAESQGGYSWGRLLQI